MSPDSGSTSTPGNQGGSPPAARYRKRPVVIEAMQFDGSRESIDAICRWANDGQDEPIISYVYTGESDVQDVCVWTLEGIHIASVGDFIIRGVAGEFYPCKPDIFAQTYEAVDE